MKTCSYCCPQLGFCHIFIPVNPLALKIGKTWLTTIPHCLAAIFSLFISHSVHCQPLHLANFLRLATFSYSFQTLFLPSSFSINMSLLSFKLTMVAQTSFRAPSYCWPSLLVLPFLPLCLALVYTQLALSPFSETCSLVSTIPHCLPTTSDILFHILLCTFPPPVS